MIVRPLNQTHLHEPKTGTAAAAREIACITILRELPRSAERLGSKLNNTQDVERMDPECSGNGVITTFGNAKGGTVDGRLVLRNQVRGSSIE